jgi:hypothetical protein
MTPGLDECLQYHINRSIARHAALSTNLVLAALAAGDGSADSITEAIADWPERRPAAFAAWETIRTSNLMAKATYFYAGATGLEWIRLDENPFCPSLEGRIIEMGANCRGTHFVLEGDEVPARSQRGDVMTPSWNVSTPPLFEGCDCQIAPVMPDPSGGMPAGRGEEVQSAMHHSDPARGWNSDAIARVLAMQAETGRMNAEGLRILGQIVQNARAPEIHFDVTHAPEIKVEPRIEMPETDMQPMAEAVERAISRVGEALGGLEIPPANIEFKPELRVEPAPVQIIDQRSFPKRMTEQQKILRNKKGEMVGTVGQREYFEE